MILSSLTSSLMMSTFTQNGLLIEPSTFAFSVSDASFRRLAVSKLFLQILWWSWSYWPRRRWKIMLLPFVWEKMYILLCVCVCVFQLVRFIYFDLVNCADSTFLLQITDCVGSRQTLILLVLIVQEVPFVEKLVKRYHISFQITLFFHCFFCANRA